MNTTNTARTTYRVWSCSWRRDGDRIVPSNGNLCDATGTIRSGTREEMQQAIDEMGGGRIVTVIDGVEYVTTYEVTAETTHEVL